MTRQPCEVCGKEDLIPFTCSYCGKVFCAEHHLPEKHDCASLPTTSPPYVVEKLEYTRLKKAAEEIRPITPFVPPRKQQKSKAKVLAILVLFIGIMAAFTVSNTVGLSPLTVFNTLDLSPPIIQIISPRMTTYNIGAISLTYMVNEPISWMGYSLNNAEKVELTSNITLRSLPTGRYNLTVYANDTAGNMGFSEVTFTVTNTLDSLNELISFVREDNLSDAVWTVNYTCAGFAEDFIQRAETKGYYCFTYYALYGDELDEYTNAVESIRIVEKHSWGTETRWYTVDMLRNAATLGWGHAVVKTTIKSVGVVVDPQTDIILTIEDFTVLYEGEITQD